MGDMMRSMMLLLAAAAAAAVCAPAESQAPADLPFSYADMADLALTAPVAAHVRVAKATVLRGKRAPGVPPQFARFYVEADLVSLIRGPNPLPARIKYVVDLPRDARGKVPKLRKGTQLLLLAAPVAGRPDELRLVAPDAQLPWSAERAAQLRGILGEATSPTPAPRIVGIGKAFSVAGSLPGESETQIFLLTERGDPVSLNILRRPGETPRWAVALSEIVDEAAGPPQRGTLLWYRLACSLPRTLPRQSLSEADPRSAAAIEADYSLVLEALGPCGRNRARR